MILPFDQTSSHIFKNEDIESESDLTLSDFYDNEDTFFPKNEDSFSDLLKTKPSSKDMKLYKKLEDLNNQEPQKEINLDKQILPEYFDLKKIKELLIGKLHTDIIKELDNKIFQETSIINFESNINDLAFIGKKRMKRGNDIKKDDKGKNKIKLSTTEKHNKYSGDNIIKKIKLKLLEGFLKFVNKVINGTLDKAKLIRYNKILRPFKSNNEKCEDLLKIMNYKNIRRLNKNIDLSILYMPFKELFSKDISPIFSKLKRDSNKIIIEKLLQEEYNKENIIFVLNMRFKDWIDIFTFKREFNSISNIHDKNFDNLVGYLEYVDKLILDIYRKNSKDNYLLYYIIYLYNYERWFCLKTGRNRISKKNQ